ncbi:MAG: SIR2 family NAD-dependent protein deacylase [Lentisphaeria bacterium]
MLNQTVIGTVREAVRKNGRIVILTGAGISAESGVPTFRGPEGYWTIGSEVYQPQEMATLQMFQRHPEAIWGWYLHRATVCHDAVPNQGHKALVDLENLLGDRFTLITQNVDNLHIRADSSDARTLQIHGNLFCMRCIDGCVRTVYPLPEQLLGKKRNEALSPSERSLLKCQDCGGTTRPHVLWFDEYYNEEWYRCDSAMQAADEAQLLIVAGTSGATSLPMQVAQRVFENDHAIIDINIAPNPFSDLAQRSNGGAFIQSTGATALPVLVESISAAVI